MPNDSGLGLAATSVITSRREDTTHIQDMKDNNDIKDIRDIKDNKDNTAVVFNEYKRTTRTNRTYLRFWANIKPSTKEITLPVLFVVYL